MLAISRPLPSPLATLWARRALVRTMVGRELKARYRGSLAGMAWSVIQPMTMLALYTLVFSAILRVKFGHDGSTIAFSFYLFSGLLPWMAFSEALGRSPNVMLENANLVKKVVFPLELLPVNLTMLGLVNQLIGLGVMAVGLLAWHHALPWTVLLLPLLMAVQGVFTQGLAWLFASLGVFARDVGQAMGLVLTAWMFMTPIMYPATSVPARLHWVLALNPMAGLVMAYRAVLLEGQLPNWGTLGVFAVVAAATFGVGYVWFMRTKHAFADVL